MMMPTQTSKTATRKGRVERRTLEDYSGGVEIICLLCRVSPEVFVTSMIDPPLEGTNVSSLLVE